VDKAAVFKPGREISLETYPSGTLDLDFLNSRTLRKLIAVV
jgi:hypothetical protein